MTTQYLFAGFGGQGILFAGKLLAYKGLMDGKNVSWLPSYGPEMRGGTANCSVIVSDEPIGAPIVLNPDVLIAMNLPSLDRYENDVVPGGTIYVDSSLIERKVTRDDVTVRYIPATSLAAQKGLDGLANMIIMGNLLNNEGSLASESLEKALGKCISARHADRLQLNRDAMSLGSEL
ncbi:MAG: 2-oxoacid:acceptor oxidoreductase family protein [Clostridia bacterium]|nr:2-oxoacid:acceptor oxidoreductase family protein [Clostridia bacterium]